MSMQVALPSHFNWKFVYWCQNKQPSKHFLPSVWIQSKKEIRNCFYSTFWSFRAARECLWQNLKIIKAIQWEPSSRTTNRFVLLSINDGKPKWTCQLAATYNTNSMANYSSNRTNHTSNVKCDFVFNLNRIKCLIERAKAFNCIQFEIESWKKKKKSHCFSCGRATTKCRHFTCW